MKWKIIYHTNDFSNTCFTSDYAEPPDKLYDTQEEAEMALKAFLFDIVLKKNEEYDSAQFNLAVCLIDYNCEYKYDVYFTDEETSDYYLEMYYGFERVE